MRQTASRRLFLRSAASAAAGAPLINFATASTVLAAEDARRHAEALCLPHHGPYARRGHACAQGRTQIQW